MKHLILALFLIAGCGPKPIDPDIPVPVPGIKSYKIGSPAVAGQTYKWAPVTGLDDATLAQPMASPTCTTVYEVTATNQCGVAKSSMTFHAMKKNDKGELVEVKCQNEEGK